MKLSALCFATSILSFSSALATPATGSKGMVATAHPLATQAGVSMLRAGGNAFDAAAASAFALSVVEQYSSGIGGGGFAVFKHRDEVSFLDFREIAPASATREMYLQDSENKPSRDGVLSVAVPGAVAGYLKLHERYGKLPRKKVLQPAIDLAAKGFRIDNRFVKYCTWRLDLLQKDPEARQLFLVKNETGDWAPPPVGKLLVQKDLAWTLRTIANKGTDGFYRGAVAKKLVTDMKERNGLITAQDLDDYEVRELNPLVGSFRGHAIATSPIPSSGGQFVLTILNLIEAKGEPFDYRHADGLHWYIEASKRAFADRVLMGDQEANHADLFIDKNRAKKLLPLIGAQASHAVMIPPGQATSVQAEELPTTQKTKERNDTTHLSVVDKEGNAVSMTTTVNYGWGSGVVAKGTGIVWNDEMDDFAIAPGVPNAYGIVGSEANAVAPGKVPLSSMTPTLVFEGPQPSGPIRLVVGSPGGSRIPTTVAQAIWHYFDHGADIQRAIAIGRIHHQHLPDQVFYEGYALEPATLAILKAKGHKFKKRTTWSNANGIAIDPETGIRTGSADPRGVGTAVAE